MPAPTAQRAFALEILQKLRAAGFEALWAGGCVRDELLGLAPKDYDVATSATPDQIRELFGRRRTLAIGAAFGVVTVLGPRRPGTRQRAPTASLTSPHFAPTRHTATAAIPTASRLPMPSTTPSAAISRSTVCSTTPLQSK
jgi:hypothetical protein